MAAAAFDHMARGCEQDITTQRGTELLLRQHKRRNALVLGCGGTHLDLASEDSPKVVWSAPSPNSSACSRLPMRLGPP